ncbi:hypothetical protein V6N12_063456 [Hibiscus sabdariffa]|uniref:Uncharacterized protein n=1 Tax=Hibiscus sabdariffa TaxID=183260 RepID=A0ABR2FC67_9ROSI
MRTAPLPYLVFFGQVGNHNEYQGSLGVDAVGYEDKRGCMVSCCRGTASRAGLPIQLATVFVFVSVSSLVRL